MRSTSKKALHVPTIAAATIRRVVDHGVRSGLSRATLLKRSGLTESVLDDAESRLPITCGHALLQYMSEALEDRAIALSIARSMLPQEFGVLAFALMTASSGREALDRLAVHSVATNPSGRWLEVPHEDCVEVCWQRRGPRSLGLYLGNELTIAAFVQHFRATMPSFATLRVTFAHAPPRDIEPFKTFFRCPVVFRARHNALFLPLWFLSERPRVEAPVLGEFLGQVVGTPDKTTRNDDLLEHLQAAIRAELADGAPGMSPIARRLGISQRTLRRRLDEESTSFRELVHQVRRQWAEELLAQPDLAMSEIATKLGFAHGPAFTRAFRSWTGETPLSFRRRSSED